MAKFGIGVGEEFPINEPPGRGPSESEADYAERRRHWRRHYWLHVATTRIAVIALIVAFIVWMFIPQPMPVLPDGARGYYGYRHHFFPFPLLMILLFALAWRALAHRRWHHHHHHWDHGPRRRDREEA